MLELVVQNDSQLKEISFNYEELKTALAPKLNEYKSKIYDDSAIVLAKKDKATLNNLKKSINQRKIEVKKECMMPYERFEGQVKDLISMIDGAVTEIDSQVKTYDEKVKAKKKAEIESYYSENIEELENLLTFDKIFVPKWLNTTVSMKSIKAEIDEVILRTKSDLELIDTLDSDYQTELKSLYLSCLDLSMVMRRKQQLEEQKKAFEEIERKRTLEKEKHSNEPITPKVTETRSNITPQPENDTSEPVETIEVAFKVVVTREQLESLKKFMVTNGIKYGRA